MTAPAKAPARRLLATYPDRVQAAAAAIWWAGPPEHAKGVEVVPSQQHDRDERPFAVTADKSTAGGGS